MSKRLKRVKSTHEKKVVLQNQESEGEFVNTSKRSRISAKRPSGKLAQQKVTEHEYDGIEIDEESKSPKFRMSMEQEEMFVQKCVERFEGISQMKTIRGTPVSTNYKNYQQNNQLSWTAITNEMNEICGVS